VSHKVKLSRGPESTLHSTRKHFEGLIQNYSKVQIVNLLSKNTLSPEYQLNEAYKSMVLSLTEFSRQIQFYNYDFHAEVQRDRYERLEDLAMEMKPISKEFGYNVHDTTLDVVIQRQYGIMRTNCLDCLDRTNVVQTLFAKKQLQMWIQQLGVSISGFDKENLETVFNNLWADNGDWLSKIYAGTGALKSSYTRNGKQTVFGKRIL
jgi:synaptojanin